MEWVTFAEIAAAVRAMAFSLAITEILKRLIRWRGREVEASTLWFLSGFMALLAGVDQLRALDVLSMPIWMWGVIIFAATPLSHRIFINGAAEFAQKLIAKHLGIELNLKDIVTGRAYKPHVRKVIKTPEGPRAVPLDYVTDPEKGEETISPFIDHDDDTEPRGGRQQ